MPPPAWPRYAAFGLRIASAVPLDPYLVREDVAEGDTPDLDVCEGDGSEDRTDDSLEVEWPGLVRAHVQGGCRMWVDRRGGASQRALAEAIAGPALAIALAQRGCFVLHASAVAIDGGVVAVGGHSGAGKSTMAALLVAAGGRSFSDDFAPVHIGSGGVESVAGPTLAKLDDLPPAAAGHAMPAGPEAAGSKQLYAWRRAAAPGERAPLAAVLLVEDGAAPELHRLRGQDALAGLLRVAFGLAVGSARRQAEHLALAAALAARVPVARLVRPRTLEGAARAVELARRHLLQGGSWP